MTTPPFKLLHKELRLTNALRLNDNHDVNLISKNISHARLSCLPKLPDTFDQFHDAIDDIPTMTYQQEEFLLINDRDNNVIGFRTEHNLKMRVKSKVLFCDGTFYSCPDPFLQLFTIHGYHNNVYMPLVFFLLPNKCQKSYELTFHYLIKKCKDLELQLAPSEI